MIVMIKRQFMFRVCSIKPTQLLHFIFYQLVDLVIGKQGPIQHGNRPTSRITIRSAESLNFLQVWNFNADFVSHHPPCGTFKVRINLWLQDSAR